MSHSIYGCIFRLLIVCTPCIALAASDNDVSSDFLYCAVVFNAGKAASTNPTVTQYSGRQYTKYLLSSLAFASGDYVKEKYVSALNKHNDFLKENANSDNFGKELSGLMNSCVQSQKTYQAKVDSYFSAKSSEGKETFETKEAITTPLDTLIALGKPEHEDYNPDGRFSYLFPSEIGSDVYLFDRSNKLMRVVKYCDSLKAKCP